MDIVTVDGMVEHDFRRSIEDMLRLDQVDEAVDRLHALLEAHGGAGTILPARFLGVSAREVRLAGWERLAERLLDHDRPNHPITAIGVTMADPRALGGSGSRGGYLAPFIKTYYFNDDAYPFSEATRDDLLDGYSRDGFEWQGDFQATDATLAVKGIDDLYAAVIELENRLFDIAEPDPREVRAGVIASCFIAALIHQAVRDTIRNEGLPRPLCVFAACDGVYPYFDAPVVGSDGCTIDEAAAEVLKANSPVDEAGADEEEFAEEPAGMASLLNLAMPRTTKAPVMVLSADDADEAERYREMAGADRLEIDEESAARIAVEYTQLAARSDDDWAHDEAVDLDCGWTERRASTEEFIGFAPVPPVEDFAEPFAGDQVDLGAAFEAADPVFEAVDEAEEPEAPIELAAPVRHSIRARINVAEPVASEPVHVGLGGLLRRLWSRFSRRPIPSDPGVGQAGRGLDVVEEVDLAPAEALNR